MKRGQKIVVEVEQLSNRGDGVGFFDGKEVNIRGAVPGDKVEAYIKKKRKGRLEASVVEFLRYGIERQTPSCQHFGICGGCCWQDLAYADQLEIKERMVISILENKGLQMVEIKPILQSPTPLYYRNKMEFSFGMDPQGNLQLGLHVRGRFNHLFDVVNCWLQSEISNRILRSVRQEASSQGLAAYDLKKHQGLLRFLVIREGKRSGEVMVNLVVSEYPCDAVDRLIKVVLQEIPEITTFVVTLHQGKAQVAMGQREFVLKDRGKIVENCAGLTFEISAQSFFQTNPLQAENLYKVVAQLAGNLEGKEVLDLYCGTGGIGLYLARGARLVLGVELVPEAVEDARYNALQNGIQNSRFVAGSVEDILTNLQEDGQQFDLVVLDPPRAGLHQKLRMALGRLNPPQLIYVSCNPLSLADDLEVLCASGYLAEVVQPIDMFPQTPHCEVVVKLARCT